MKSSSTERATLYIFIFLHQTTTDVQLSTNLLGCISLYSYIKPQLLSRLPRRIRSCISLYSYIKPQRASCPGHPYQVVYLYIPTSNHNSPLNSSMPHALYIFIFLHQTTTIIYYVIGHFGCISLYSYIKPQLKPQSDKRTSGCISLYSYIKPQLAVDRYGQLNSCISLYSYIKPQRIKECPCFDASCISLYSYIKPQPTAARIEETACCISLYSYIKPQLWMVRHHVARVVYLYIPTSNHNRDDGGYCRLSVVYLYIPTSNHNKSTCRNVSAALYIFIFLHQTTTTVFNSAF